MKLLHRFLAVALFAVLSTGLAAVSQAVLLTDWSTADVRMQLDPVNDPIDPPFLHPAQDIIAAYYKTDGVFYYFRMDLISPPGPGASAPEYSFQVNNAPGGDDNSSTGYVAYPLTGVDVLLVSHWADQTGVWTASHRHFTTGGGVDTTMLETVNVLSGSPMTTSDLPGSVFDATEDAGGGPGSMLQWKVAVTDFGAAPLEEVYAVTYDNNNVFGGTFDITLANPPVPDVDIEKSTNGVDADVPTGPVLEAGALVTWDFTVTNNGDLTLTDIVVTDDQLGLIGTIPSLAPGSSTTLQAFGTAVVGQYANVGTATGTYVFEGTPGTVSDSDPSHYFGKEPDDGGGDDPENPGTGTIGYWKNHPDAWPADLIEIGGVVYTKDEAIAWMKTPVKRDKSVSLYKQLVATVLNVAIGNDDSCVADTILLADAWLELNPVGSKVRAKSADWKNVGADLHETLDDYNNGLLCAPHRD